ncbi:uncharacterized protein VDAG_02636 [Verticillium dahliae VdLs.17]|uniref:Protein kinase domain-containing protein n=1 Tax=Verticillium dahliae (strain VdLs.17 / ATCC MYA-4575 / FGSC 10137) TaxID=498257 RepID=G2WYF4_VERDV|nr:uncharacterized protein VDAG_02636 [Verticillium dahliae VdLs.17]EGY21112.1 hypothetical protein VDAG_02636 [Verticillium dahliae VdLs.17]KAH6707087.1 kinase-like domain-containing protein [Verticillium dahliae]
MQRASLYKQHLPFTHGGHFWRDQYLLERWAGCVQPVVYLNDFCHKYKLLRRLGDWSWLTKDPVTNKYLTLKFISRPSRRELTICQFVKEHCFSPNVSTITDSFTIPHHLSKGGRNTPSILFDAIVYPTTGVDLRRVSTPCEHPQSPAPLSIDRRMQCVRHLIRGIADLHRARIVHGDIHPGNVVLPPPLDSDIERLLEQEPLEHRICRKDGAPTSRLLPERVTEPVDIGYGVGQVQIIDLGYAFQPSEGAAFTRRDFPRGTPLPPELIGKNASTVLPFLVDSWQLGLTLYFILTDGFSIMEGGCHKSDEQVRSHYSDQIAQLRHGKDEGLEQLPVSIRPNLTTILLLLLCHDPAQRLSVEKLSQNAWLMEEANSRFE